MRDLVERQLAIDIFDDLQIAHEKGIEGAYEYYRKEMCGLPSIQSESTRGYWIILGGNDRKCSVCNYVFHKLTEEQNFCPNCSCDMRAIDTKGGQDRIDDALTIEPEIIRCKDCKHRGEEPIADGRYWCELHDTFMYYCSDAERRTDE